MKKIYIAGFDVFEVNRNEIFANISKICAKYNMKALIPLDSVATTSNDIFKANIALINQADGVVANLNAFRGKEPDSGTVFEVGYAYALKKPIVGYTSIQNWSEHIQIEQNGLCKDGYYVENFGKRLNLMLSESILLVDTIDQAVENMIDKLR